MRVTSFHMLVRQKKKAVPNRQLAQTNGQIMLRVFLLTGISHPSFSLSLSSPRLLSDTSFKMAYVPAVWVLARPSVVSLNENEILAAAERIPRRQLRSGFVRPVPS